MAPDKDYKDFRCYELLDSGEKQEIDVEIDKLSTLLHPENVLMLVRFDLRRLFIWKGPKSPVRKRFISSREGSKIQEDSAKVGMHLKIISVDAGDEPGEFLQAFHLQSFEVKEEDKMEDLVYIRNEERRKMEEAAIAEQKKAKKTDSQEYFSPALEEAKKAEKKAAQAAAAAGKPVTNMPSPNVQTEKSIPQQSAIKNTAPALAPASIPKPMQAMQPRTEVMSEAAEKSILDQMLKEPLPEGFKRLNLIIGTHLYGPQRVITKVFGKEMEKEEWGRIAELPEGKVDIDMGFIRAYIKNNEVVGIEILKPVEGKNNSPVAESPSQQDSSKNNNADKPKGKRELPPIPKGE